VKKTDTVSRKYSDFWLDGFDTINDSWSSPQEKKSRDLVRMSAARRAISNFVSILTGQQIPVIFYEGDTSFTDGKKVVISADFQNTDFDPTVGLALHEAAHIMKSNFELITLLESRIPSDVYERAKKKGYANKKQVAGFVKLMLNYVEDRFIDDYVYRQAPGYRGYYVALYNKYFHSPIVADGLRSSKHRVENIDSYFFRMLNLTNAQTNLDALKGLKQISDVLDVENVSRLRTPNARLSVSLDIARIIFDSIDVFAPPPPMPSDAQVMVDPNNCAGGGSSMEINTTPEPEEDSSDSEKDKKAGGESEGDEEDKKDKDKKGDKEGDADEGDEGGDEDDSGAGKDGKEEKDEEAGKGSDDGEGEDSEGDEEDDEDGEDESKDGKGEKEKKSNQITLTPEQASELEKVIEAQKKFIEGMIEKAALTNQEQKELKNIEESGTDLVRVAKELSDDRFGTGVDCVVVRNMTHSLIDSPTFPFHGGGFISDQRIENGIRLGTVLGRKLQIRGEVRDTKFLRQENGKIERRLLSGLGYNYDRVFSQISVSQYKKAALHISVDASCSMAGAKWTQAMTCVVAICKAASMIENLRVVVSFRGCTAGTGPTLPYIVVAYDSSKDKFIKVPTLLSKLAPRGGTPEGLTFEAILNLIPQSHAELDSYFLNLSDGEPSFSTSDGIGDGFTYSGNLAGIHTRRQVEKMRKSGIRVLSYFIQSSSLYGDTCSELFRIMYGIDAKYIDVTNVMQIAQTMNARFLTK